MMVVMVCLMLMLCDDVEFDGVWDVVHNGVSGGEGSGKVNT